MRIEIKKTLVILSIFLLILPQAGIPVAAQEENHVGNNSQEIHAAELPIESSTVLDMTIVDSTSASQSASPSAVLPVSPTLTPAPSPVFDLAPRITSGKLKTAPTIRQFVRKSFRAGRRVEFVVDQATPDMVDIEVVHISGRKPDVQIEKKQSFANTTVTLTPTGSFIPGRYTVRAKGADGSQSEQSFLWGVLAINMDKSAYRPGETSHIAFAVLDEYGRMVCDASLSLEMTDPLGSKQSFQTEDGTIQVNDACFIHDYTQEPDYEASTPVGDIVGDYAMTLTAVTKNGTYTIFETLRVRDDDPFEVRRSMPTRIFPPATYPVALDIVAHEDFSGHIIDIVPESFVVEPADTGKSYDDVYITNSSSLESERQEFQLRYPFDGQFPISARFGDDIEDKEILAYYTAAGVNGHDGIDFDVPEQTPIFASDTGTIIFAEDGAYGNTIVIQHEWGKSYYGHLNTFAIQSGQRVDKGDLIGLSGSTGYVTAPHLHFGLKFTENDLTNGYYGKVDPLPYLTASAVVHDDSSVKVISWDVTLKKGDRVTLGYAFRTPPVSPYLYFVGPLRFRVAGALDDENLDQLMQEEIRDTESLIASDSASIHEIGDTVHDNPFTLGVATASAAFEEQVVDAPSKPVHRIFAEYRRWRLAVDEPDSNGILAYSADGDATPHYRSWNGTDLGNENNLLDEEASHGEVVRTLLKASPVENEYIYIAASWGAGGSANESHLDVQVYENGGWGNGTNAPTDGDFTTDLMDSAAGTENWYMPFDVSYEQTTGHALIVYENDASANDGTVAYRTWDGDSWSGESTYTHPTTDATAEVRYVRMTARPGTDDILVVLSTSSADLSYVLWDGSAFDTDNDGEITAALQSAVHQNWDVAWESNGNTALVVYGTGTVIDYCVYDGTSCTDQDPTTTGLTTTGGVASRYVELDADRDSDHIALMVANTQSSMDLYVDMWDGTDWDTAAAEPGPENTIEEGAVDDVTQVFDVAWEMGSDQALFAFVENGSTTLDYFMYDISDDAWTCPENGDTISDLDNAEGSDGPCNESSVSFADDIGEVRLRPSKTDGQIMMIGYNNITTPFQPELMLWSGVGNSWSQTATMGSFEGDLSPDVWSTPTASDNQPMAVDFTWESPSAGSATLDQLLRHGAWFSNGVKQAFTF